MLYMKMPAYAGSLLIVFLCGCLSDFLYKKETSQRDVKVSVVESGEVALACDDVVSDHSKNVGHTETCCIWGDDNSSAYFCSPIYEHYSALCHWENKEPNSYQLLWFQSNQQLESCFHAGIAKAECDVNFQSEEVIALSSYCADCRLDICSAVIEDDRINITAVHNFCPIEYPEDIPLCDDCDRYSEVANHHIHHIRIPKTDYLPIYVTVYTADNEDAEACEYPEEPPI